MKITNIYDSKLIILDLNFYLIETWNLDYVLSMQKTLKQLSANQNLLIVTDTPHHIAINTIDSLSLKVGYLIANSGSCVYNLSLKKVVTENILDVVLAKCVIKLSIWNKLNFVVNTKDHHSYVYKINSWMIQKYKSDLHYVMDFEKKTLNDWNHIIELLETTEIYSIEIFFHEDDDIKRAQKIKTFLKKISGVFEFNYTINVSVLYIYSPKSCKFDCIKKISEEKNIELSKNSMYLGIDQCCEQTINNSYFSIISNNFFISNPNFYIEKKQITDVFSSGKDNWMHWLVKHSYLWKEPIETKYKNLFLLGKNTIFKSNEIIAIQKLKHKCFYLNETNQEITFADPIIGHKLSLLKSKKQVVKNQTISKCFFWPNYIEYIIHLLNQKHS